MGDINKIWESVFNYSDYEKGGEYSASDLTGDILAVRLRRDNPTIREMKYEDKISAFVGSSIHTQIEKYIESENAFSETNMQSEVKLKYRNLSGTADLIIDGKILDWKTGKESSISATIKKPDKWIVQISIYSYLLSKQLNKPMNTIGYIAWLCTDTQKHGVLELELLSLAEVTKLIKEFMVDIDKPLEELPKCDLCIQFKHRCCQVKSICPFWKIDDDFSNISEW